MEIKDAKENERLCDFFKDIEALFRKHNVSISHQDEHGAFVIQNFNDSNLVWLINATDETVPIQKLEIKRAVRHLDCVAIEGCKSAGETLEL